MVVPIRKSLGQPFRQFFLLFLRHVDLIHRAGEVGGALKHLQIAMIANLSAPLRGECQSARSPRRRGSVRTKMQACDGSHTVTLIVGEMGD